METIKVENGTEILEPLGIIEESPAYWRLVGRGRALEIILGADDFNAKTAELYGYVNRALPDAELDAFVDNFARRIASFDQRPIAAAKNLINNIALPSADDLLEELNSFRIALTKAGFS